MRPPPPLGTFDLVASLGAVLGLALIAGAAWALAPLRGAMEAIRAEPEVAGRARADAVRAGDGADAARAVDAAVEAAYRAREAVLRPVLTGEGTAEERFAAIRAWGELRATWARALAEAGVSAEAYRAHAATRPARAYDPLLAPPRTADR